MIVVDASVLAPTLSDDGIEGDHLRQCLRGQTVLAPELVDLEVQSVLRDNLTTYDAAYVALAEVLGATLLTTDSKLANAPGIRCQVDLVQFPPS